MSFQYERAKAHGQMGRAAWFDRHRKIQMRAYHLFSIRRMVWSEGHMWLLIVGPWAIAWGHTPNKAGRGQA